MEEVTSNEPCPTCEWVMFLSEWVMADMWMSHVLQWISHGGHVHDECPAYQYRNGKGRQQWVMSQLWMSHVPNEQSCLTYECVRDLHWTGACPACDYVMSCVPRQKGKGRQQWVMSHMWMSYGPHSMSHGTHMYKSWRACKWVMSHTPTQKWKRSPATSHVPHVNESCPLVNESRRTCEWVLSRIPKQKYKRSLAMSHVPHVNESCPHVNESWHTHEWVMVDMWMGHVPHTKHRNGRGRQHEHEQWVTSHM